MIVEPLLAQNKYIQLCLRIIISSGVYLLYLTYLSQIHQIPLGQKNCPTLYFIWALKAIRFLFLVGFVH